MEADGGGRRPLTGWLILWLYNLRKRLFELPARFINTNSASGFYEPLALRLLFFRRGFGGAFRRASSFGLCIHWRSPSTSRSISQALADDASQGAFEATVIIHPNCNASVIAEIKFSQITVKVLLGALLIDALHTAFED